MSKIAELETKLAEAGALINRLLKSNGATLAENEKLLKEIAALRTRNIMRTMKTRQALAATKRKKRAGKHNAS